MDYLFDQPNHYRLFFSLFGLIFFLTMGLIFPYRKSKELSNPKRLFKNIGFSFVNAIFVVLIVPISLIEISLNHSLDWFSILKFNPIFHFLFGVILLDFTVYWQHRFFHKNSFLWRMHRFHHSDTEFDTTTGGRFHILEVLSSFLIKAFMVVIFGLSPMSIVVFEIILNFSSSFNHTNIHFNSSFERFLRLILITPDLHRTHHSTKSKSMNSNFGFSISLWDRIFGSLNEDKSENQQMMKVGLNHFRSSKEQTILALMAQPFSSEK